MDLDEQIDEILDWQVHMLVRESILQYVSKHNEVKITDEIINADKRKAKDQIEALIAEQVKQARLDELERLKNDIGLFPMSYGRDDDKWQERQRNIAKIDKRLAELENQ